MFKDQARIGMVSMSGSPGVIGEESNNGMTRCTHTTYRLWYPPKTNNKQKVAVVVVVVTYHHGVHL